GETTRRPSVHQADAREGPDHVGPALEAGSGVFVGRLLALPPEVGPPGAQGPALRERPRDCKDATAHRVAGTNWKPTWTPRLRGSLSVGGISVLFTIVSSTRTGVCATGKLSVWVLPLGTVTYMRRWISPRSTAWCL